MFIFPEGGDFKEWRLLLIRKIEEHDQDIERLREEVVGLRIKVAVYAALAGAAGLLLPPLFGFILDLIRDGAKRDGLEDLRNRREGRTEEHDPSSAATRQKNLQGSLWRPLEGTEDKTVVLPGFRPSQKGGR